MPKLLCLGDAILPLPNGGSFAFDPHSCQIHRFEAVYARGTFTAELKSDNGNFHVVLSCAGGFSMRVFSAKDVDSFSGILGLDRHIVSAYIDQFFKVSLPE